MKKNALLLLFIILFIFSMFMPGFAAANIPVLNSQNVYLAELSGGRVMYENNSDEKVGTGYLSKIITGILVFENITDLEQEVTVTFDDISGTTNDANAYLKDGETMTVSNLLYCLLVRSGCDAANVLARLVGGDTRTFVTMMNEKAKDLGCKNTVFKNPSGMDEDGQYTTAYDMYLIAKAAIETPMFMDYADVPFKRIPATNMTTDDRYFISNNYLIVTSTSVDKKYRDAYYERKAYGLMSSETDNAGNSAVTLLKSNDIQYVCVVLNAQRDADTNFRGSYQDVKKLSDWVFSSYKYSTVAKAKTPVIEKPVKLSRSAEYITLVLAEDVNGLFPVDIEEEQYDIKYDVDEYYKAPIKKGDVLGSVTYSYDGIEYAKCDLLAQNTVDSSFVDVIIDDIWMFLTGPIFLSIVGAVMLVAIVVLIVKLMRKRKHDRYRHRRY